MECLAVIVIATISVATLQLGLGKPVPSFELVQPGYGARCLRASCARRRSPLSRTNTTAGHRTSRAS